MPRAPRKVVAPRKGFAEVVGAGDRRAALAALRDRLAASIEAAEVAQVAALARQLRDVLREIDELPSGVEESVSDDLARRRATRLAAAPAAPGAGVP